MKVRALTGRVELSPAEEQFKERLSKAADQVEAYKANYDDETEVRNKILLEAIDAGVSRANVARWCRLDPSRVTQIVAAVAPR